MTRCDFSRFTLIVSMNRMNDCLNVVLALDNCFKTDMKNADLSFQFICIT